MIATPTNELAFADLVNKATAAYAAGDCDMAEHHLSQARAHFESQPEQLISLGHVYLEHGRFDSAIGCYERAGRLRPEWSVAQSSRALALQLMDRPADAQLAADLALLLNPADALALMVLIRTNLVNGCFAVAKQMCTRLLALDPTNEHARRMLCECDAACPASTAQAVVSPARADSQFAKLFSDYPDRVAAWRNLGTEHLLQQFFVGDFDAPIAAYPKPRPCPLGTDGLPLPPMDLTMGYGAGDMTEYVGSARRTYASLTRALADHHVTLEAGDQILDWGCAAGRVLRMFQAEAGRGCGLWGGDVHSASIRWATDHLAPPFRFFNCSSVPRLPFPDRTFKFIYAISVMTHLVAGRDLWLLELQRVLRPDGLLLLTVHDEHTWSWFREHGHPAWMPTALRPLPEMPGECVEVRGSQWDHTYTFFNSEYLQRVWGQFFHVAEIRPLDHEYQTAVVLRPKPGLLSRV